MPTAGSIAVVLFLLLFLLLFPALCCSQKADPDKPRGPAHEQPTQQSGSTGDSATQPGAATESKPEKVVPTPAATPADQKALDSEGSRPSACFGLFQTLRP